MIRRPGRRDLYDADFRALCLDLAAVTVSFRPDVVIGIRTGGDRVAQLMLDRLGDPGYVPVTLQRPATRVKSRSGVGAVAGRLPRRVADALRWLEVESRELVVGRRTAADIDAAARALVDTTELSDVGATAERVLIVDDTIDSGRTLSVVQRAAQLVAPGAQVRTAVLASTWRRPPVQADWCLLDRTLLRMPWSLDADRAA